MNEQNKRKWGLKVANVLNTWPRRFISYQEMANRLGLTLPRHRCLAHGLGWLKERDMSQKRPVRSARVVNIKTVNNKLKIKVGNGYFRDDEWNDDPRIRETIWKNQLEGIY